MTTLAAVADETADDALAYAIRTVGLTRRFGSHVAVNSVDLAVPRGAIYGFLGPNGSGKTTTIRLLLGLMSAHAGSIELLGAPMPSGAGQVLARVGTLIEGPAFHPYLTGAENLRRLDAFDPTTDPRTASGRIAHALERVGLTSAARKNYRRYSLGMKQRLGLAAALLRPRDVLVLDEPTNGLDPQGTREVRTLVRELAADGTTVLVSSHLLAEIEQVATHVGIMSAGRLLRQGELSDVLDAAASRIRIDTPDVAGASRLLAGIGCGVEETAPDHVIAMMDGKAPEQINEQLVRGGIAVRGLRVERAGLEDFFVELTGEGFDVVR